jgi:hypothetical protein
MQRYNLLLRSSAHWSTRFKPRSCLPTQLRHSSGSPTKTNVPADHFIKTGEKPQDPADNVGRSDEYSQSGGDDMVAQQSGASFDVRTPFLSKHSHSAW